MRCQLTHGLPLVDVLIGHSDAYREYCQPALEPTPPDIAVRALVDTGASISVIDSSVISRLRLKDRGVCKVRGFDGGSKEASSSNEYLNYDVALALIDEIGLPGIRVGNLQAVGAPMGYEGYDVLLGLDFLKHCTLTLRFGSGELSVDPA